MKRAILLFCFDNDAHIVAHGNFDDMLLLYVKNVQYYTFMESLVEGLMRLVVCDSEEQFEEFLSYSPDMLDLEFSLKAVCA